MRKHSQLLGVLLISIIIAGSLYPQGTTETPPLTKVEQVIDTLHSILIEDPYRWLEDQNSPQTREWIDAQNQYTQSYMALFPGKDILKKRYEELMKIDKITMPSERNGRYFLYKREGDQEQYIIYMRESLDGKDRVLVDPHLIDPDNNTSVGISSISKDGTLLAYSLRQGGEDEVEIHFLNVDTKDELDDILPKGRYFGISIKPDKSGIFYSSFDDNGPRVNYHAFGSKISDDILIFGEEYDSEKIISSSLSEDGHYLIMSLYYGSSGSKTEIYYKDLFNDTPVIPLVNDIDAEFYGSVAGDIMYMKTNWKASNWRIIAADLTNPSKENWSEVIPNSEAVIENFSLTGGKIFVNYLENVNSHVEIYTPDGKEAGEISFPSLGTVSGVYGHWDGNEAFYQFTSFHIPSTIYHYDLSTDEQEIWAQQNVPVNTDNIEVKQIWFQSKDGTKVPMFVVHKKGLELDGNNPTYLTGYGGFNSSYKPYFSSTAVLWVEQGGIYVVTNLRGGGEFGDAWHRAAMFEKKQNTFDDFIAAAEWLIENKYTSPSKLAIAGGSNGGLLVGAALTQRPDLFQAVLCSYPLLDMLRYHKFLVGSFWISEYGSADSAEQFEYIYKYSPYHNVHQGTKYPSVLFVTGDADTRVDPCHARKMTALLQSATTPDNPVLLYYDTKAGHSRGTPLTKRIDDQVVKIGFLSWQLGMNWE